MTIRASSRFIPMLVLGLGPAPLPPARSRRPYCASARFPVPDEAAHLREALYQRWLPEWIGAGTMEIRVTADPQVEWAMVGYASSEQRFDLLEVHPGAFYEQWPRVEDRPLLPFLEWSPTSTRWPRARREALLLARHEAPNPPDPSPWLPSVATVGWEAASR
ncbi:hypothetical protein HS125_12595 [bacterium]|nr:hypothetical protein [bacterium]